MKRSFFNRIFKLNFLAIPAAALMLGAGQSVNGQTQIGINFGGYRSYGVSATAFGIDATNWFTTPISGTGIGYLGDSGTNVIAFPAGGSLTLAWSSANTWNSGIGDNGSGFPTPGNPEVTWAYLDDGGSGYKASITGLRSFVGSFSVQTIAASDGATGFGNVTLMTNNVAAETLNYTNDPSQFVANGGGGYGVSTLSGTYSATAGSDSITLVAPTHSGSIRSTLAGFIFTYTIANNLPLMTTQPQSVTNNFFAGNPFTLSATANGTPTLAYQWRQTGVPITGATNASYTNLNAAVGDSGNYDVVITNNYGAITSAVAVVTVQNVTTPSITQAPVSQNLYLGYPATFTVSALGGQLTYQWKFNGTPIPGATNTTYTIPSITSSYAGTYTIAVSNPVGPTANASATLAVKIPVPGSYEDMMSQTRPDLWFRYSETGAVAQDTAANSGGSLGSAGTGLYVGVTHAVAGAIVASSDKAAYFNGTASILKVPFNAQLNTSAFTAEAWVKPGAVLGSGVLFAPISCGDFASPRKGWLIYQSSTGWDLRAYNNNGTAIGMEVVGGTTPDTNTWYHLAVTYNGTTLTLYVNGASVGTATDTGGLYVPGTAGPFALGARADNSFYWNGSIDEVAAYGTALPANKILAHYQNGISSSPAQSYSSLIAGDSPLLYLHLNEPNFTPTVAVNSGTAGAGWNGGFIDAAGTAGNPLITIGQTGPLPPLYPGLEATNHSIAMSNGYCAAPLLPVNESVTLVSWAYLQNPATTGDLGWIGWMGNGGLYVTAGGVLHYQWPDSAASYNFASGLTIPAQTWVFTALVVSPTQTTIYMSSGTNLLSATHTFARTAGLGATAPFGFGGDQAGRGDRNYIGGLDESAVYVRSLTPDQINAIFQAGLGTPRTLQIAPGGLIKDSKPVGTPHNGANYKTTWLASGLNFDQSVRRTGVEQFNQTNNSQITVAPDPDLNITNGTICFWVNYNGVPTGSGTGGAMLFDRRAGTGNASDGATITMTTGGSINFQPHGGTSFGSSASVNDGDWHHVAITFGQTTNDADSIYIDGNLDTSLNNVANWIWSPTEQIELGRSHDPYYYVYGGGMDDFRMYNAVLSPTQILAIYNGDDANLTDPTDLKLRFNFDADPSLFGSSLNWSFGALQSSPVLGPGAVWTTITNAASPLPLQINPSVPALFYRSAFSPY